MQNPDQISLIVNGELMNVPAGTGVEGLLAILKLQPGAVIVEYNGNILVAEKRAETCLQHGDSLELIQFVGGG